MHEDPDVLETQGWREALRSVVEFEGCGRAAYVLAALHDEARRHAVAAPVSATHHPVRQHDPGRRAAAVPR